MDYKLGVPLMIHRVSSIFDELVLHLIISFDSTSIGGTPGWREDS